MIKKHITVILILIMFASCTSLKKDFSVNSSMSQTEKNFLEIEKTIVSLEAMGGIEARREQSGIQTARRLIGDMEKEAAVDADYSGRLIAWSGRLAILEGRYSEAQRLYRQSNALSAGNIPCIILGIKLEGDPEKRLELIEKELVIAGRQTSSPGVGELQIERGNSLIELNRFAEAAGAFDAAFSSGLNAVYRESFTENRNRSWELRNASGVGTGTLEMLGRDSLSWKDCINITKNETQLLRFISGGRDIGDSEFFNRLLDRAFLPYTQDIEVLNWPINKPMIEDIVTRAGAAWFVWHLYAEARANRALLSRYSARYATGANPRSPIADVPPLTPFFDSILGCVETELLSLPDGKNFNPNQTIRGAEFLMILKKIDN